MSSQRRGLALLLVRSLTPSSSPRLRKTHPLLGPHYGVTTSEYSETVSAVLQIWPFCKKLTNYLKQSDRGNSFKSGNAFWILMRALSSQPRDWSKQRKFISTNQLSAYIRKADSYSQSELRRQVTWLQRRLRLEPIKESVSSQNTKPSLDSILAGV